MATPTYELISSQTISSAYNVVLFDSIPATYQHLEIDITGNFAGACYAQYNYPTSGNGTNIHSYTMMYASTNDGVKSIRSSNANEFQLQLSAGTFTAIVFRLFQYANTNVYKTGLVRSGSPNAMVSSAVGLWRSTNAINSVRLVADANFSVGSVINLWGVA